MGDYKPKDQYYIQFKAGDQRRFLREVKERRFSSWEEMASFLQSSRSSIFSYLREQYKLPRCSFEKLKEEASIDMDGYVFKENLFHTYKSFNVAVSHSIELAEIVG